MQIRRFIDELRKTLVLAFPITAGHLSQMLLGFVDTLMIGRVGVVALAAVAFSNAVINIFFIGGIGLLTAVQVYVSYAYGAGNKNEAAEVLRRGSFIACVTGIFIFGLVWVGYPLLEHLGQPVDMVRASRNYLWLLALSMPFALLTITFKNYSEAQDVPWPAFWSGLVAVLINILLNWILIYGNWGFPAFGLTGAGVATLLSRIINLVLLVAWLKSDARFVDAWPECWFARIPLKGIQRMLHLGFPVSIQLCMEIGAFGAATLLMGFIGIVEVAAHQIAITYAATAFMVPLGISLAVAIRVGHVVGSGQPERARSIGFGAIGFACLLSGLFAVLFVCFNRPLAGYFSKDLETVAVASVLLVIAGFFQFLDASQVLAIGALRGLKDVKIPTLIVFVAYWIIAIPLGALLSLYFNFGASGVWLGLAGGLAFAAAGLILRFNFLSRLPSL